MAQRKISAADKRAAKNLMRLWHQHNTALVMAGEGRLTQEEAGYQMGMGQSAVGQFLRGEVPLGIAPVLKFARLLDQDPRAIRNDLADLNWALDRVAADNRLS